MHFQELTRSLIKKLFIICLAICIVSVLTIAPLPALGQGEDTTYIQRFSDTLNLRLLWANKGLDLQVSNLHGDSSFFYGPRHRHYAGFGGVLWNIAFNFLLPLPDPQQRDEIKRFDFQGSLFAKDWLLDGIYQRYRGYYINPVEEGVRDQPEYFNSELLVRKIKASITYLPGGNRISLRAPFNYGARQVKSAGSFLLSGGFSYTRVQGEDGILPVTWIAESDAVLRGIRLISLNSLIGYTGTWVHKNFFVHFLGQTGFGFQQKKYKQKHVENIFSLKPIYDVRAAIGYDNGHFYMGIYGIMDYASFQVEQWHFQELTSQIRVSIGIRFTEPEFLQNIKPRYLERLQNSPNIPLPAIFE